MAKQMTAERLAGKIRRNQDQTEYEFRGWSLLVLDYPDCDPDRQVKVSPDRERPDDGAFWLDVDSELEAELEALGWIGLLVGSPGGAPVPADGGG